MKIEKKKNQTKPPMSVRMTKESHAALKKLRKKYPHASICSLIRSALVHASKAI